MSPSPKKLLAIVVGVLLVGGPVLALKLWLDTLVEHHAQEEVNLSARRTVALIESRLAKAAATLDELLARGANECTPSNLEILRTAAFANSSVKEISVLAADGQTLCTDVGGPFEPRRVISSEPLSVGSDFLLEVVRVGDRRDDMVRLHRPGQGEARGLGALMPADQFVAQVSTQGGPVKAYASVVTRAGTVIGHRGTPPKAEGASDRVVSTLSSQRYGLTVTMSLPRALVSDSGGDLQTLGLIITLAIGVVLLGLFIAFRMLLAQRRRENPVAEMERALQAGEFVPYYQPVVDIRSGKIRGAEVLLRWKKPDGTVELPAAFIPLAETSGLIVDLTRMLMRHVSEEAGPIFGPRPHLRVGFNLTAQHFADEQIVRDVREIFGRSQVRLRQVILEVTERHPLDDLVETRRVIAALQGLGVRIAIDDVGTGHSGLSYMLKLGVDIIKIDKMFVDALGTDRNSNTIIEMLIDLAQNLRMEVIAEGVENFEQVVNLRELGIRAAQGHVFAPPLPGSAFRQLVEAIDPIKAPSEQDVMEPRRISR